VDLEAELLVRVICRHRVAWIGFDKKQRRGVVVLTTANGLSPETIGWTVLQRLPLKPESRWEFAREIVGLGFLIGLDEQTKALRVTKVFSESPASRAGLSAGLVIQKVEDVPTAGKSLTECQHLLRANGRAKVRLELVNTETFAVLGLTSVPRSRPRAPRCGRA
jgi:hypothetical protein